MEVTCEEYLRGVREWADREGLREDLEKKLEYLDTYGEGAVCRLYEDFAPQSFGFSWEKDGRHMISGSLIYHPSDRSWGVHT